MPATATRPTPVGSTGTRATSRSTPDAELVTAAAVTPGNAGDASVTLALLEPTWSRPRRPSHVAIDGGQGHAVQSRGGHRQPVPLSGEPHPRPLVKRVGGIAGLTRRHGLVESRMRGDAHVRFGGRAGETGQLRGWHRAPVRPCEWAKRQLAKRGVGYVGLDNGFRAVDDPALLDELTGSLGADDIRAWFARWMAQLPQPLTAEDRAAGYGYALSMLQVEVSDTRVFDRPIRAGQWFEATTTEQLTLGRPEKVSLLFGRRPNRRSTWRFETRVVNAYTSPTITFRYKHSTVKQYLKGGLALRTETTINDAYDFDLGRRIDNLASVRARGEAINAALLEHEANAETARLEGPELTDLVRPTVIDGRRIAALRLGDPRVMALLAAVVLLAHLPRSNGQTRAL